MFSVKKSSQKRLKKFLLFSFSAFFTYLFLITSLQNYLFISSMLSYIKLSPPSLEKDLVFSKLERIVSALPPKCQSIAEKNLAYLNKSLKEYADDYNSLKPVLEENTFVVYLQTLFNPILVLKLYQIYTEYDHLNFVEKIVFFSILNCEYQLRKNQFQLPNEIEKSFNR
jgi:hypothetical protein